GIQSPRRVGDGGEQWAERTGKARQREHDEEAADADRELEQRIQPYRSFHARVEPRDEAVAEREAAHEGREHEARAPDAVAERQPGEPEPHGLERQPGDT